MKFIDNLLDQITMYRLVLYYLMLLIGIAMIFGGFGLLPFKPLFLLLSIGFLVIISLITHQLFAFVYHAVTNVESVYISALILGLILAPIKSLSDLPLLFWAAVLTVASKYIFAIKMKHVFNPVAMAVVLTALGFGGSATWWIGTGVMLPFALLGLLIVRKIRRYDLVVYFFSASIITMLGISLMQGGNLLTTLKHILLASPIFFFAFVMLTEPLTMPSTKRWQMIYGVVIGILFAPQFHVLSFYTTPELALVIGNILAYLVSSKAKVIATITQKIQLAPDMIDFILRPPTKLAFLPGQYMEWTMPHHKPDSRGNRRYFTIASSPTEDTIRLGVKFYPGGSSYKKAMADIDTQTQVVGAQLSGDFTLPTDLTQKLVFMAGGIGITPFRSMIKYLIDTKQSRPIVLFYANKTVEEIVYADVFNQAQTELGIKTIYTLTDIAKVSAGWQGKVGRIDAAMIMAEVPDFMARTFYLSGPHTMVSAYQATLRTMGVPAPQIKTDYFPGFV